MGKSFSREAASRLWKYLQLTSSNHRLHVRQHEGNVLFVGYADLIIWVNGERLLALPGTSIKLMGDQVHFEPKQEQARDGSERYFPVWLPITSESRAVLTELIKADRDIANMIQQAVDKTTNAAPTAEGPDPFAG